MPTFIRLTDYRSSDAKEEGFFEFKNQYKSTQKDFKKIPGQPIVYWFNNKLLETFDQTLFGETPIYTGMATSDNDRFLRFWHELSTNAINFKANSIEDTKKNMKWFPYNKGGSVRKWYGNFEYIVNFHNDGKEIKDEVNRKYPYLKGNTGFYIRYQEHYFKKGLTWSAVSSGMFSVRLHSEHSIFSNAGFVAIPENNIIYYLGLLNTTYASYIIEALAQTINNNASDIAKLPIIFPDSETIKQQIETLTQQNIDISKSEWDSRETSWDFTKNELLKHKQDGSLENALIAYSKHWSEQFNTLHANEEELNRLFIDIYGLQDELTPDVALEDITILKSEAKIVNNQLEFQYQEIIKQFISYSVGCMLGRYSFDEDGLVVANQNQSIPTGTTFEIDDDNIIPIVDESDYFSDDMTDRFTEFVRTTFGSEKLQQNIAFIESALKKKVRAYFQKDFYVDHTKRYKKRPIYWLFTSPKGTFQTLIYMHRYTPDTLNHILNDYLRPFRIRLDSMREESMRITESESSSSREKTDADKKIDKIDKTLDDITEYEKTLAHYAAQRIEIDLDDGVKVNYCKFKELLFEFDKKLCK